MSAREQLNHLDHFEVYGRMSDFRFESRRDRHASAGGTGAPGSHGAKRDLRSDRNGVPARREASFSDIMELWNQDLTIPGFRGSGEASY